MICDPCKTAADNHLRLRSAIGSDPEWTSEGVRELAEEFRQEHLKLCVNATSPESGACMCQHRIPLDVPRASG